MVSVLSRTYAPRGCPPVIITSTEINLRLYLASAVSARGDLCYMIRNQPFDSGAIIEYLEYLHETLAGKLLIIWDNASIHDSELVRRYLATKTQGEFCLVMQPRYSPELNADEQVWNYLKNYTLKNTSNPTANELKEKITRTMEQLKGQPQLIQNFFHHPDLGFYN